MPCPPPTNLVLSEGQDRSLRSHVSGVRVGHPQQSHERLIADVRLVLDMPRAGGGQHKRIDDLVNEIGIDGLSAYGTEESHRRDCVGD